MVEKPNNLPFDGFFNKDGVSQLSFNDLGIVITILHNQKKISLSLDGGKTSELLDDNSEKRNYVIKKISNMKMIYGGLASFFFMKSPIEI